MRLDDDYFTIAQVIGIYQKLRSVHMLRGDESTVRSMKGILLSSMVSVKGLLLSGVVSSVFVAVLMGCICRLYKSGHLGAMLRSLRAQGSIVLKFRKKKWE